MADKTWLVPCLHLTLLVCLSNCAILKSPGSSDDGGSDDFGTELNSLDVGIKPGSSPEYDKEGAWICPETFQLTFALDLKPLSIRLERAPGRRSVKVPIYLSAAENHTELYSGKITKQYCNYQDVYTTSAFTISLQGSDYILDGTFRKEGKLFGIRPGGTHKKRPKRSTTTKHSLFLLSQDDNYSEAERQIHSRSRRQAKTRYVVEVLVVIDFSVYQKFESYSEGDNEEEKTDNTIENIAYHFAHIMNEVSMRFASITDQDYEIGVQLESFMLSQSPSTSPWTDTNAKKGDIYVVMSKLQHYINNIFPLIVDMPDFDHAVLFTEKDLANLDNNPELPDGVVGGSTIAGACSYQRMSAIENRDMYKTSFAAAHELAHNLGAYHDGQHNSCSSKKMYLMAPSIQVRNETNYRNIYQFSSCSKRELQAGLRNISRSYTCLLRTSAVDDSSGELAKRLATLPGQKYSLDRQCKEIVDSDSYFCGRDLSPEMMCGKLSCWFKDLRSCGTYRDQPADQGTTCGRGKWCMDGRCVSDNRAPLIDPSCVYGDIRQVEVEVRGRAVKRTCAQVVNERPSACYTKKNYDLCCESCGKIQNTNNVGCEYGDRDESCKSLFPLRDLCPQPGIGQLCCETCRNYQNTPDGGTVRNPDNDNDNRNDRNNNDNTNSDQNRNDNDDNNPPPQPPINNGNANSNDCDSGWTFNSASRMCYRLTQEYRSGVKWSDAKQVCTGMGGTLATPKTSQQNRAIADVIRSERANDRNVWIGLFHQSGASNSPNNYDRRFGWKWVDGSPSDQNVFNAWSGSEPGPGEMWVRMRQGEWLAIANEYDAIRAMCQRPVSSSSSPVPVPAPVPQNPPIQNPFPDPNIPPPQPAPQPAPPASPNNRQSDGTGTCGGSSEWEYNSAVNLCYYMSQRRENQVRWSDAQRFCQGKGGHLATPSDSQQGQAVSDLIQKNNALQENVWIGLSRDQGSQSPSISERRRNWRWVNGQAYNSNGWSNWESDEPGFGEKWVRMRGGKWLAIGDEWNANYAVCQKDISP